jgi:hypothetical protein
LLDDETDDLALRRGSRRASEDGLQTYLDAGAVIVAARATRPGCTENGLAAPDHDGARTWNEWQLDKPADRVEESLVGRTARGELLAVAVPERRADRLGFGDLCREGERAVHAAERDEVSALVDDGDSDLPIVGGCVTMCSCNERLGLCEAERHRRKYRMSKATGARVAVGVYPADEF